MNDNCYVNCLKVKISIIIQFFQQSDIQAKRNIFVFGDPMPVKHTLIVSLAMSISSYKGGKSDILE